MDIHEDAKTNTVTATFELPGLKKDDVNIDVHNNILTVSGESKVDENRDENGWAVRERRYGKFSRSVPLPQGIKACYFICIQVLYQFLTYIFTGRRGQGRFGERCSHRDIPQNISGASSQEDHHLLNLESKSMLSQCPMLYQ